MTVIAPRTSLVPTVALPRHLVRFAAVSVANTVLFLAVYLLFRTVLPATGANVLATVLTTVTGTAANGRVTFGVDGAIGVRRHLKSMAITVLGLVITTGAVSLVGAGGGTVDEMAVLVVAGAVAGGLRFALLRHWVFAPAVD
ncbi:GtrA family protein [Actinokineospora sp. NBRC 105648]|uniref:GtrA family protein n=1 Tax=Actinokineospora sp. NBRC 105648 TaxID=3032206 RepID=UPI00255406C6|nr:GtrA family protein [Actinokineospora sp. NBRC 105648]